MPKIRRDLRGLYENRARIQEAAILEILAKTCGDDPTVGPGCNSDSPNPGTKFRLARKRSRFINLIHAMTSTFIRPIANIIRETKITPWI